MISITEVVPEAEVGHAVHCGPLEFRICLSWAAELYKKSIFPQ